MVHEALAASEQLRKEDIEVEVVDLRCVKPLDLDTVLASVARTARLSTPKSLPAW
jgi:acetoin:2,6-dichlorophenolindophenol oxidoreductase subunit beta